MVILPMPTKVDRVGERHNRLCVTSKSDRGPRSHWVCVCDCGQNVVVSNSNLVTGNTKSCGCVWDAAVKGLMVGQKFGCLTVVSADASRVLGGAKFAYYSCKCDCGEVVSACAMSLRNGDIKSCGCAYKKAGALRLKPAEHHRASANARNHARRASKLRANRPACIELFGLVMNEAHRLTKLRLKATGIQHDVDHFVPLNSKVVCGLHNEFNIRVITASLNRSKSNRYWPNMPTEDLCSK